MELTRIKLNIANPAKPKRAVQLSFRDRASCPGLRERQRRAECCPAFRQKWREQRPDGHL